MRWEKQLRIYENNKEWDFAIFLLQKILKNGDSDLNVYLCLMYLIMNLLVEEDYETSKAKDYEARLKKMFLDSYTLFNKNAEYLFYMGIIALMSEWYLDLDESEAKDMLKEAVKLQPQNNLYNWGYYTYLGNNSDKKNSLAYARKILLDSNSLEELESKGTLGEYVLEQITYCSL